MKLNKDTLTDEQLKLIDKGYNFSISVKGKITMTDPVIPNYFSIEKDFQKAMRIFSNYSRFEEDEAQKFIDTGASEFITDILIDGEKGKDLANEILDKAKIYKKDYSLAIKIKKQRLKDLEIKK